MNNDKILNALSYFSLFFAPILVPIAIWIFGTTKDVKHHAKVALFTHILPIIGLGIVAIILATFSINIDSVYTLSFITFGSIIAFLIMSLSLIIFNIVRGVQALVKDDFY